MVAATRTAPSNTVLRCHDPVSALACSMHAPKLDPRPESPMMLLADRNDQPVLEPRYCVRIVELDRPMNGSTCGGEETETERERERERERQGAGKQRNTGSRLHASIHTCIYKHAPVFYR